MQYRLTPPQIKQFSTLDWPFMAAKSIQDAIAAVLYEKGECSVMLTGGRSAQRLYEAWADISSFRQMKGARFYFADERCVPPDHAESNFGMAMRTLFRRGVPEGCAVLRMKAENVDREAAAQFYGEELPAEIDVLILSMGEDGHIASLFPGASALSEYHRRVAAITGPKPPYHRITITRPVITEAKSIYLLALGRKKGRVLRRALTSSVDIPSLPVQLTLKGNWLLDNDAAEEASRLELD